MRAGVTVSPEANLAFVRFWTLSLAIIDTMSSRAGRLPGCGSGTGVVTAASPMILISLFFSVVHAGRDLVANRHGTLHFKGPDAHSELPAMATASIFKTGMTNLSTDVFQSISQPDKVDLSNNVDRGPAFSAFFFSRSSTTKNFWVQRSLFKLVEYFENILDMSNGMVFGLEPAVDARGAVPTRVSSTSEELEFNVSSGSHPVDLASKIAGCIWEYHSFTDGYEVPTQFAYSPLIFGRFMPGAFIRVSISHALWISIKALRRSTARFSTVWIGAFASA